MPARPAARCWERGSRMLAKARLESMRQRFSRRELFHDAFNTFTGLYVEVMGLEAELRSAVFWGQHSDD